MTPQRTASTTPARINSRRTTGGVGHGCALVSVAAATALIYLAPGADHIANVPLLYLLVVLGVALRFGRGPAVTASLLSFLAFDWFFVAPRYTFTVTAPAEWLALFVFLVTAMVTGHLTALLAARAEEARRRERETAALAEASWAVASQVDRDRALNEVLRRVSDVVDPDAAAILVTDAAGQIVSAARYEREPGQLPSFGAGPATEAARFVLDRRAAVGWEGEGRHWEKALAQAEHPDASYLPLTTDRHVLGVFYLRLPKDHPVTPEERRAVESLANHAAVVLERDRLSQTETHARALEEADRLKTALLSMVSHDFRSPLAAIKAGASALLQDGAPMDPTTQRELLDGIDQETDRLNRVVGNLLALSRLEADAWRPQTEPTDPAELVGTALGAFNAEQNRRIHVQLDPSVVEIVLDPVQISQVLHNLVDNALKYSSPNQPVEVVTRKHGKNLVLEVLDRGPGLVEGEEERVFERFYRAPAFRESAVPGVGIGLAVCRGLVEAHHGHLTARNRSGGGAVFQVSMPLAPGETCP